MSDRIDELVETVRTACEVIDDEGSTPSRPCTVYGDALTELAAYIERLEAERDEQHKRADFFRDALDALHECPPAHLDYPCKGRKGEACPYEGDDGIPGYAACWDEVERRQRDEQADG